MTPHFLAHIFYIIRSIEQIQEYVASGRASLEKSLVYDAILYRLQTLAESASKLPDDIKAMHSDVAWAEIYRLRNAVVHDYLGDFFQEDAWRSIQKYLPPLKAAMLTHVPNWDEIKHEHEL